MAQVITTPAGDKIIRKLAQDVNIGDVLYSDKSRVVSVSKEGNNVNIECYRGHGVYTYKHNPILVHA